VAKAAGSTAQVVLGLGFGDEGVAKAAGSTAQVVLGLGFGDEGKGTIVDYLARRAPAPPLVVRWNGGPQAAHHVVTDDGRSHCFAQLGSASFVAGARTHLAAGMAVDLYALHVEAQVFGDGVLDRVTVDPGCVLVTPWHAILGRVREALRGAGRHGSTGRGVAEAVLGRHLVAGQLAAGRGFDDDVRALRAALRATATDLIGEARCDDARELIARGDDPDLCDAFLDAAHQPLAITARPAPAEHVIFESAQGALLDRDHGFFPHVTPSRITRRAAEAAARALGISGPLEVWGVLRAYHTRHGEGPFPSEDAALAARLPELHNREDGPAGRFRVGWFDAVLARHAIGFAGPIDRLAITCFDRVADLPDRAIVDAWREAGPVDTAVPIVQPVASLPEAIARALGRPIDVASWGPAAADKRDGDGVSFVSSSTIKRS